MTPVLGCIYTHKQKNTHLCAPLQTLNITDKLSGYIGYQIVHQISKCVPFRRYITIYGVGYTPFVALSRRENDMLIYVCLDQTKVIAMDCWLHIPVSLPWLFHYKKHYSTLGFALSHQIRLVLQFYIPKNMNMSL